MPPPADAVTPERTVEDEVAWEAAVRLKATGHSSYPRHDSEGSVALAYAQTCFADGFYARALADRFDAEYNAVTPAELEAAIEWRGDMDDDCCAEWCGLTAHAECMDVYRDDDPDSGDSWYCCVYRGKESLFHSAEDDIHPLTGPAARRLCELVMRHFAAAKQVRA